jgi:hypothetical protein
LRSANVIYQVSSFQSLKFDTVVQLYNKLDKNEVIEHYKKVKEFATLNNIILKDFNFEKYF